MSEPEQLDLLDWLAAQPPLPSAAPPAKKSDALVELTEPVLLTLEDLACNMRRFYSVALACSLFGERGVVRNWGRIGTAGQVRTDWYNGMDEAALALQGLLRAKRKRGYRS